MTTPQLLELLQSGDFTIAYHDNGYCCLYKGQMQYDELHGKKEKAEYWDEDGEGYTPEIVALLVKALGGKTCSR